MPPIYLDNNATTQPDPRVLDRIHEVALQHYGNPGSQHQIGRKARQVLEDSREQIASLLGATPDGVVFTSGATESNNLALFALARGRGAVAATPGEHPATEEVLKELHAIGWKRQSLDLDRRGQLRPFQLDEKVRLATAIYAHNETGVILDLDQLKASCQQQRIPWHLDATQAIGKIPVDFASLGCTTMSFAAHKFHGPRGIGCLIARSGVTLASRTVGGHQESGRRAGTEPVALVAGMAIALELAIQEYAERTEKMRRTRDLLEQRLSEVIPDLVIHGAQSSRLPNTSCIGFPGLSGQALLVALDVAGVCCSMGSACASGSPEAAPVLLAMGVDESLALASLRFSTSCHTTDDEIAHAVVAIVEAVKRAKSDVR